MLSQELNNGKITYINSKINKPEYSASDINRAAKALFPYRKNALSQLTEEANFIRPSGNTMFKGRRRFKESEAAMILLARRLKEEGVIRDKYKHSISDIIDCIDTDTADTTYILGDSHECKIYDATKETPVISILEEKSQFFWSFALGFEVKNIIENLRAKKHIKRDK